MEENILYQIKRIIEQNYELKNIEITENKNSTDKNVYNILTSKKKYILKMYNNKEHTISMVKLLNELKNKDLYIPKIIENNHNEGYTQYDNEFFVIYSFLEGQELGDVFENIPDDISIILARELRKFHDKCKELKNIGLKEVNLYNNKMRKSILHFDLTRNNIFYNKDNGKIGFIDFDDAKYGDTIIDVAILIANLYFSKTRGCHNEGVKKFIDEYYKDDIRTKNIELPLIKETAIKWIDYVLEKQEFDSSTISSLEARKKLIKEIEFEKMA